MSVQESLNEGRVGELHGVSSIASNTESIRIRSVELGVSVASSGDLGAGSSQVTDELSSVGASAAHVVLSGEVG